MKEVVNVEELVKSEAMLMIVFFSTSPYLQFRVRDNTKQTL